MTRLHELAREFGVETSYETEWGLEMPSTGRSLRRVPRRDNDIAMDLLAKLGNPTLFYVSNGTWDIGEGPFGIHSFESAVTALAEKCREGK